MSINSSPPSSTVRHDAHTPLASAGGDSASGEVAMVKPHVARMKKFGKGLLDNMPVVISIGFTFAKSSFATYFLCWCSVSLALVALVVDVVHCHRRWAAGLEAVFPKMITVTYFIMNAVILGLLYSGVLEIDMVYILNGCFITGGLFIASSASLLLRRPWIYAMAVEFMPPEKLQVIRRTPEGIAVFKEIMTAITALWTALFFVMFCINLACTIWKVYGGSQAITQITNIVVTAFIVILAIRRWQPRVIEMSKEKAMERIATRATNPV